MWQVPQLLHKRRIIPRSMDKLMQLIRIADALICTIWASVGSA